MEKNNERQDLFEVKSDQFEAKNDQFDPKSNQLNWKNNQQNECPKKDKDGNCLVPGVYRDSDEIGGG